ncbi:AMP deaminase 2-like [Artemia franciscana]|uniref:AMP deaminase n=1 Tax=Artemia franciscana TaxID=6661 RepID=A0AA88H4V0_ARTSF|nr:hypothetical protein QYM36_018211 [Artemia franciscana]
MKIGPEKENSVGTTSNVFNFFQNFPATSTSSIKILKECLCKREFDDPIDEHISRNETTTLKSNESFRVSAKQKGKNCTNNQNIDFEHPGAKKGEGDKSFEESIEFRKIKIVPNDKTSIFGEEFRASSCLLVQALGLRRRYMHIANQSFPKLAGRFLDCTKDKKLVKKISETPQKARKLDLLKDAARQKPTGETDYPTHGPSNFREHYKCSNGVFHVYAGENDVTSNKAVKYDYVDVETFRKDLQLLCAMIVNGPLKTFSYRRLAFLNHKYHMHELLNEQQEVSEQKSIPYRDFYNIQKVDTHIHAAACMNHKHLLSFMQKKLHDEGDRVVEVEEDGNPKTLKEVFDEMKITHSDLTVDSLDMHCDKYTFHRFDIFNKKYNPAGNSRLREIFLKVDNYIEGEYFGSIIKEVMNDLEESQYQSTEMRISIAGKSIEEWDKVARWVIKWDVYSKNVIWLMQIPRVYDILRSYENVANFQSVIDNIFRPLFEVTNNPSTHPELHHFLQHVVGFDSVDDESKPEQDSFGCEIIIPEEWTSTENPPYWYYTYYTYANLCALNQSRKDRGLNTFTFRPHCGEAGPVEHLAVGFLLAENISHGIMLRKAPILAYLYYLSEIGIAMSPISNNLLFLNYSRNPLKEFLNRGLKISLSTDDPLLFHLTNEPLMEEYSIATQMWQLNGPDLAELARNSVLMSGFSHQIKKDWLGFNYREEGVQGNDVTKTNVPNIRIAYRYETLFEELTNIFIAFIGEETLF